jgi:transposase
MSKKIEPTVLTLSEESSLKELLNKSTLKARILTRARILLALHQGKSPKNIASDLFVSVPTVYLTRRLYAQVGLNGAIYDAPRSGAPIQISGKARAAITALACTNAPEGHTTWTLQMLADKAIELKFVETISYGSVHNILKKTKLSPINMLIGA